MIGLFAGEKGQFLAAFWCRERQCIKMTGTSRRPNVATSQRRNVPTSRRPNVVTPQRRDVESTYKEVNKRQRCDASASYSSQSLKEKGEQNSRGIEDQGTYELGHGNQNSSDIVLEEEPVICIFLRFAQ